MTPVRKEHRLFWLRRLHSLTGVAPVGIFFVTHLWLNARAMQGQPAFEGTVRTLQALPGLLALEVLGIGVPLLFHAGFGVVLVLRSRPNVQRHPYGRNWAYTLQRVTGVLTLGFLGLHLYTLRLQVALGTLRPSDLFSTLCDALSATTDAGVPVAASIYLVGVAAASYHFANGLAGFCSTWGLVVTERAARIVGAFTTTAGAALFLMGSCTVVYYATGSRWFVAESNGAADPVADVRNGATPQGGRPR